MSGQHTPGPWKVDSHLGMIVGPDGAPISGADNYQLAAAAPELLEVAHVLAALEADDGGRRFPSKEDCALARAAIAKATQKGT